MTEKNNTPTTVPDSDTEMLNKSLFIYQNLFVSSVVSTVLLMKKVSTENESKIPEIKKSSHKKLLETCEQILNQYKNNENKTYVDQVKIIKKVFNVLKENLSLVVNKDSDLFSIKTPENKIMTIIPGLNISLNVELMTEEDKTELWDNIYSMFISSVKMVYMNTDKARYKQEVLDVVSYCEKELITKNKVLNNFFLGLNRDSTNNCSMDDLMSKEVIIPGTESQAGVLGSLGIDKLMDVENLSAEIKKFNDSDINDTINTLTTLLGGDSDVKDVCSTMVKSVLEDIKSNGIQNVMSIAERVSSKIGNQIDSKKMEKTAENMNNLLKNNADKINNLTDENGNPFGGDFLKKFQSTYNMAQFFNKK
jgi:hypothetical protein